MILDKGADVHEKDNRGKTALMMASDNECLPKDAQEIITLMENLRTKVMTALVIKKGLTRKGNKPLVPYAHREIIHRIASFF